MTHIHLDLAALSPLEARALSAMLLVLIAGAEGQSPVPTVQHSEMVAPVLNAPEKKYLPAAPMVPLTKCPVVELAAGPVPEEAPTFIPTEEATPAAIEPTPEPEKPKRTRRTKAEMEAAKDAEEAPLTATEVLNSLPNIPAGAPTLDQLREASQHYVDVHGMKKAVELLAEFECARVSELQNISVDDQNTFLKLAQNA